MVITNGSWIVQHLLESLNLDPALNLELRSGTPVSKRQESLSTEIWRSISDDLSHSSLTMSFLLWGEKEGVGGSKEVRRRELVEVKRWEGKGHFVATHSAHFRPFTLPYIA